MANSSFPMARTGSANSGFNLGNADNSGVDVNMLDEWNQLVQREYELDVQLESLEQAVYDRHPFGGMARIIFQEKHRVDGKMSMDKRLRLTRMREKARQLTIELELFYEQYPIKLELQVTEFRLRQIEQRMKECAMNGLFTFDVFHLSTCPNQQA